MLKGRLSYLDQRQQVIAQNVANSDTPGYTPNDLKPFTLQQASGASLGLAMSPVRTSTMHLPGIHQTATAWGPQATPDSETRLDGNKVVLEEEMMKMQDARLNYNTALGLYQKSLSLIQMALRAPGK
jgi:flagellar basal-body rod protein FlgB